MLSGEAIKDIIDSKGILRYDGSICVLRVRNLIQSIFHEAYSSRYSTHPGRPKMYRDLRKHNW